MKAIIDSSSEVRVTWRKTLLLLAAIVVTWNVVNHVWHRKTGDPWFGVSVPEVQAQAAEPTPTATPTATATHVVPARVVEPRVIEVVVTATPTEIPPTPEVVYYQVPVEVTRVVTQTIQLEAPTPTATPALASGTVRVCVHLEGAREVYIGGAGVVSGGCQTFSFGVGQTSIAVQINK